MTELQEEITIMPDASSLINDEEKNKLLNNIDPRINNEKGDSLWTICFDETIDWNALSCKNLVTYHPMFKYDGPLYCLSLFHQVLFQERQLVRKEGEYTDYDNQIFQLGKLKRLYRNNINQ